MEQNGQFSNNNGLNSPEIKNKFYKERWFLVACVLIIIAGIIATLILVANQKSSTEDNNASSAEKSSKTQKAEVPAEYLSAVEKAESYTSTIYLSKKSTYDQLVSDFGGNYSPEAAQYAVDNANVDWKENALIKAKSYKESMQLSSEGIHDLLTSEYGGQFTDEEADYAIKNLND